MSAPVATRTDREGAGATTVVGRGARRRRRLAVVAVVVGVVIASTVGLVGWAPMFAVSTVTVTGNALVPTGVVADAAVVPTGQRLLTIDTEAIAARVRRLPQVASVTVSRRWPSTVEIAVVERVAVASITAGAGGPDQAVDVSGAVFAAPIVGLPRLVIAPQAVTSPASLAALAVVDGLPPTWRANVASVTAGSADSVVLTLRSGTVVRWGGVDDGARKAAVVDALLPGRPRIIDVSAPDLPTTSGGTLPR